jgi:hypothetical protein
LGKKRSAEICANIRKASKGKKKEDAAKHRAKIGKAVLGKKRSAEIYANIRKAKKGKKRGPRKN